MLGLVKYLVNLKRIKMKKLFFSAMALVAFSSISMANTIAVEVKQKLEIEQTVQVEQTKDENSPRLYLSKCDQIYLSTLLKALSLEFSNDDASAIALGAYQICVERS